MADFGFDDDEFNLDTGINLDDDDTSLDIDSAPELGNNGELEFSSEQNVSNKNPKKVAIIAIIMGIVLITICLALFSLSQHLKERNRDDTQQNISNTVNSTVNDIEGNKENIGNEFNGNTDSSEDTVSSGGVNDDSNINNDNDVNDWVQFEVAGDITFDNVIDGELTVTSIQHFAKVTNIQNDKMVKSVVKGNISGLVGTYEVEIPYYKAVKLQIGTLLKIQYKYASQNGVKVIGEIIFI